MMKDASSLKRILIALAILVIGTIFVWKWSKDSEQGLSISHEDVESVCESKQNSFIAEENILHRVEDLTFGGACSTTCWFGLVPGQSTKTQALETLRNLSFVNQSDLVVIDSGGESYIKERIFWRSFFGVQSRASGVISTDYDDKILLIRVPVEYEITLEEMFERLGEPESFLYVLWAVDSPPICYQLRLYWFDLGFAAQTESLDVDQRLSPSTLVETTFYYAPMANALDYIQTTGDGTKKDLFHDWESIDAVELP